MTADLQIYLVGGAVRDGLLGLAVTEHDWVVVGATPARMRELGYQPIDADFPVFRHPESGDEYALARREIKHGEGYRGFDVYAGPDVTLDEDLRRRDLTINAIARGEDGELVDPFCGRDDLDAGLLKHVSPAFVEDPVRVLRAARFAAKLGRFGFRIAHGTHRLMCAMIKQGDLAWLTRERVWRETLKALRTEQPWRYFEVLHRCGALQVLVPQLAGAMGAAQSHAGAADSPPIVALKRITAVHADPATRVATLLSACASSADEADAMIRMLRMDRDSAELLRRVVSAADTAAQARRRSVAALLTLIRRWRGLSLPRAAMTASAVIDARYGDDALQRAMAIALEAAGGVSVDALRATGIDGRALGEALEQAREHAIARALAAG